jgi:hypothetical protein
MTPTIAGSCVVGRNTPSAASCVKPALSGSVFTAWSGFGPSANSTFWSISMKSKVELEADLSKVNVAYLRWWARLRRAVNAMAKLQARERRLRKQLDQVEEEQRQKRKRKVKPNDNDKIIDFDQLS